MLLTTIAITDALVSAVTAGASTGLTDAAKTGISDAYTAVKNLLHKKLGHESEAAQALHQVEAKPDSAARKQVLQEELGTAHADQDAELSAAVQALMQRLQAVQPQATRVQRIQGNQNAMASEGGSAAVTINRNVAKGE